MVRVSGLSRIAVLGPPASGKGTLSAMLSNKLNLPAISTGSLLRKELANRTAVGIEAASWTDKGKLFPDHLALQVVQTWMDTHGNQFIFDGFPRTLPQGVAFDELLSSKGLKLDCVVSLELGKEEIQRRFLARLTCSGCGATFNTTIEKVEEGAPCRHCGARMEKRRDDSPALLERRLAEHEERTAPLLDYYRTQNLLLSLDANSGTEAAFSALLHTFSIAR